MSAHVIPLPAGINNVIIPMVKEKKGSRPGPKFMYIYIAILKELMQQLAFYKNLEKKKLVGRGLI